MALPAARCCQKGIVSCLIFLGFVFSSFRSQKNQGFKRSQSRVMCWLQLWYIPIDFSGSGVRCTDHHVLAFFFFFPLRAFGDFYLLLSNTTFVSSADRKKLLS